MNRERQGTAVSQAADEIRLQRIRALRLKRPACKSLNWYRITSDLWDIQNDVADASWMTGDYERLYEALGEDDDAINEFRLAFADLGGDCERMQQDMEELRDISEAAFYCPDDPDSDDPPPTFDLFFPAIGMEDDLFGYDVEEHDYYSIDYYRQDYARDRARDRLKRLTKDQLIDLAGRCMNIARQYLSLTARYDALTTALSILRGETEALVRVVTGIESLYDQAVEETEDFRKTWLGGALRKLDAALGTIPERLWVE